MKYYNITYIKIPNEKVTVGVRAFNMVSAMQHIVDMNDTEYEVQFIKIEKDETVKETFQSDYRIELTPNEAN